MAFRVSNTITITQNHTQVLTEAIVGHVLNDKHWVMVVHTLNAGANDSMSVSASLDGTNYGEAVTITSTGVYDSQDYTRVPAPLWRCITAGNANNVVFTLRSMDSDPALRR